MKKIDKIIKILKDGERDFRLKPDRFKYNHGGLCFYIRRHPLLKSLKRKTQNWYVNTILKDMDNNHYHFTNTSCQEVAWFFKICGYNTERADWCKARLEEIQKEGI